jgi:hypothetical protein
MGGGIIVFPDNNGNESGSDPNAVKTTGNQTVAGIKSFSSSPIVPTPTTGDNSTKVASTEYVDNAYEVSADLTAIANLTPSNDDIIQRKSGSWTNRTIAQLLVDLGLSEIVTDIGIFSAIGLGADLTFTAHPNTEQAISSATPGRATRRFDASSYNYIKLVAHVRTGSASANNPRLYIHYSTNDISYTLLGTGTGSEIVSLTNAGFQETSWIAIPALAKGNYYFRIMIHGGDASASPALGSLHLRFKK